MPRRPAMTAAVAAVVLAAFTAGAVGVANAVADRVDAASPPAALPTPEARVPAAAVLPHDLAAAPLRHLHAPDAIVVATHPVRPRDVHRLAAKPGIRAVTVLDRGVLRLAGRRLLTIGADPGRVRGFTPTMTGRSDELWATVARGDVAVAYAESHRFRRRLGETAVAHGLHGSALRLRIGALASIGLGGAQAVVDRADARALGLHRSREVLVSAPRLAVDPLTATIHGVLGAHATVHVTRVQSRPVAVMSDYARTTIPSAYLALYRAAAGTCPGLPWTVLAAIGAVETGHGSNVHRSVKGAVGPMQFLPSTFAAYGVDGDGDGVADVQDPDDAVYSAARYLCLWGAGRGGQALYDAVFAYNHADWYVRLVFQLANAYV